MWQVTVRFSFLGTEDTLSRGQAVCAFFCDGTVRCPRVASDSGACVRRVSSPVPTFSSQEGLPVIVHSGRTLGTLARCNFSLTPRIPHRLCR